ncbi:CvpA family protein [Bacillus subtilis subsp. subtilis]|nr:CvpA family protein [Bacillus subtilis subsp. subtilis]
MIDIVLLAVIVLSALLGVMRGFVSIVISLASWVLGAWAALTFGEAAARWWAAPSAPATGHYLAGYVSVFVAVIVTVWAIGLVIRQVVRATSLNGADRLLGGVLGVARGALIGCVLLLAASYTPMTAEGSWRDSQLRAVLDPGVAWMQARMPEMPDMPRIPQLPGLDGMPGLPMALPEVNTAQLPGTELGKPGLTGDNGVLGGLLAARGWPRALDETPRQAGDPAPVGARSGMPGSSQNNDPALPRPDQPAPARNGSPGQARPPSL